MFVNTTKLFMVLNKPLSMVFSSKNYYASI
jgi:hypothetical protein